jgi:hypothetical protein
MKPLCLLHLFLRPGLDPRGFQKLPELQEDDLNVCTKACFKSYDPRESGNIAKLPVYSYLRGS